jgi:hypothetical protein
LFAGLTTLITDNAAGNTANGVVTFTGTAALVEALTAVTADSQMGAQTITVTDTTAVTLDLSDTTFTNPGNIAVDVSAASAAGVATTITMDQNVLIDAGAGTSDTVILNGDMGTVSLDTDLVEIITITAAQTGVITLDNDNTTINVNGVAASVVMGTGDDTFTGGADVQTVSITAGRDTLTLGAGADNVVITAGSGSVRITDFDFGGGAINDNLQLTATAGITDFAENAAAVTTGINAGNITFTALAADTAIADASTNVAYKIATDGADVTAVALTSTSTAIETAIAAELADGTDVATAAVQGNGFLGLIGNDANADGVVDSYFLFEYIADATNATSAVADVTLIGIFEGTDAANINAGDFI